MSTAIETQDTITDPFEDHGGSLAERMDHLEGEVAELRHTVSELADIVVGDIKERREAVTAMSLPHVPIPASLVPGGQTTLNAVNALRRPWLLFELIGEARAALRMYFDVRYRVGRSTKLIVPLVVILFGVNYLLFNYTMLDLPVFRQVAERLVEIVLAVLLYKVVSREVFRYRQAIAQVALLPRSRQAVPAALIHNDPDHAAVHRQESP